MKKSFGLIKNYFDNDNMFTKVIYVLLNLIIIINAIIEIINGNITNIVICVVSIILLFFPNFLEKKLNIKVPYILKILIYFYIFGTQILGEVNHFYLRVKYWDKIFHGLHGVIGSSIGFSLVYLLNKNSIHKVFKPFFVVLTAFCISISISVIWEVLEYTLDISFKTDSQNDRYIDSINTVYLDSKKEGNVIKIDDISYVVLYDKNNNELKKLNGYLDIGLFDTMNDLIINIVTSLLFCFYSYWYLLNKEKYCVINNFVINKYSRSIYGKDNRN